MYVKLKNNFKVLFIIIYILPILFLKPSGVASELLKKDSKHQGKQYYKKLNKEKNGKEFKDKRKNRPKIIKHFDSSKKISTDNPISMPNDI